MEIPPRKQDRRLLPELTTHIYRQFPSVLATTAVLSALVVYVLWDSFPASTLLSWLFVVYFISALRFGLYRWYLRSANGHPPADSERWLNRYSSAAVLAGMVWGAAPLLFYSHDSPLNNVFLAFVLGGLIAGASSSMAPLRMTMRIFTALVCLPLAGLFLTNGDSVNLLMGLALIVYGAAYVVMSGNTAAMIINTLRLRNENLREIEERRKAETELRKIQQELEHTVAERTSELTTANDELSEQIRERSQAESLLKASEERYRALVESSSDWIWEVNRNGTYTYSNGRVTALLGYTPDEVVGRMMYDFMPPEEADRARLLFDSKKAARKSFAGLTNHYRHKDGTERIIESSGDPVFNDTGTLVGYRGIDRDITLRVKHEEEKRRIEHFESLGLLAGGIAHDFNNLLTAVFGNIEIARTALDRDSDAGQALADAHAAMAQARKLTGQLLTFAKGGSPVLETTSVRDLIWDSCRIALSGTAVKCEYEVPDDLWMADVDASQIWQVLNNILTNAREAMSGGGTVLICAENTIVEDSTPGSLMPGKYVRLSVRDQGIGISKKDLPRIFDPYFSTKVRGEQKGTGIGLSVCRSIIEKHRGRIAVESEPGQGTTVTLFLPARDKVQAAVHPAAIEPEAPPQKLCVLMLEDDVTVIKTATRMFEHLGYTFQAVRDGKDAVELYGSRMDSGRPFDLVLLDLTIRGGMGGRETLARLKAIDPGVVSVVTTGYAEDPAIADFGRHGFDAALAKPFTIAALKQTIARALPHCQIPVTR